MQTSGSNGYTPSYTDFLPFFSPWPIDRFLHFNCLLALHFYSLPSTMATSTTDASTPFYEDEKNLKALCNFLRSSDGPAVREAIEMDKRVYYLKGKLSLTRVNLHCHRLHSKFAMLLILCLTLLQVISLSTSWLSQRKGRSGQRTFPSSKPVRRL